MPEVREIPARFLIVGTKRFRESQLTAPVSFPGHKKTEAEAEKFIKEVLAPKNPWLDWHIIQPIKSFRFFK